jgi:hypothetical protein
MGMRSCIAVGLLFPARSDVISAPAAAMGRAIVPTSRLLPALCFVLFSIAISAAANSPQSPVDLTKGATFTFKIHSKLPQFTFKILPTFYGKDEYGNGQPVMRGIGVFRGNSKVPQQYLTGCDTSDMDRPLAGIDWFHAADYNFDGYLDIYLMTMRSPMANTATCIWLYNPKTGVFDYSPAFTHIDVTSINAGSKRLLSYGNRGAGSHRLDKYAVWNNRPVLVWSEDQDVSSSAEPHCIQKERRQGKMVTVVDISGSCPTK